MNIKNNLFVFCRNHIEKRLSKCYQQMKDLQISLGSETKNSAGDKHETGRAMIQLEREQLGYQLAKLEAEKAIIDRINPEEVHQQIRLGSVVFTSQNNYFIATSIGKIKLDESIFYALSLDSPIGELLKGKRVGDEVIFRNQIIKIEKVI